MDNRSLYPLNSGCMLIVASILLGAFYFEYALHENPCPLCLLQRMGMLGVILGLSLNTYFGFSKKHFALVIMVAVCAGGCSARQILLHVCPTPGEPTGYGTPFMGMHLYSWGLLIFTASILGSALFLLCIKDEDSPAERSPSWFEKSVFYLSAAICLGNVLGAFFECGLGPCCENGPCP